MSDLNFFQDFLDTPYGIFKIVASENGIRSIAKSEEVTTVQKNGHTENAIEQLREYFEGKRKQFDVQLDTEGAPDFTKSVWEEVAKIPYGTTVSYQRIAIALNNPLSIRAVGMANRNNKIPFIIPCHRVIGSDGSMTGYFYGVEMKKSLLRMENPQVYGLQTALF